MIFNPLRGVTWQGLWSFDRRDLLSHDWKVPDHKQRLGAFRWSSVTVPGARSRRSPIDAIA